MITSPIKKGRVPQYTNFDKTFRRVSEGDTYKMPGQDERQARKAAWDKCNTTNGFTFSHPSRHRTGLGDTTGNFSRFTEWMPRGDPARLTKDTMPPPPKANIMTNPVKKGGFGIPHLTMGRGTEFHYMPDPYARAQELERAERQFVHEMMMANGGGRPMNTMSHARDCFDRTIYTDPEALRGGYHDAGSTRDPLMEGRPPMIPSSPPKRLTAYTGCFSKFPKALPPRPMKERRPHPPVERAVFIPSSPAKSQRCTSIMFRSI